MKLKKKSIYKLLVQSRQKTSRLDQAIFVASKNIVIKNASVMTTIMAIALMFMGKIIRSIVPNLKHKVKVHVPIRSLDVKLSGDFKRRRLIPE